MTYTLLGFAAGRPVVWLALSESGGAYAEAAEAIRAELQHGSSTAEIVAAPWRELNGQPEPAPRLVVAIGVAALRGMQESGRPLPLLATLVPRAVWAGSAAASPSGRPQSAVWLDQPVSRQFDLLRLAMPSRLRVGVLLGPDSRIFESDLQRTATERNMSAIAARTDGVESLSAVLQHVLEDADVLLALADPHVYNGATIQNILTSAYRRRIPLAGFSPTYVKAGALLALYSTPAQVGTQAGEIVRAYLMGRPLPPAQGPRDFSISVNTDVARSLGISIEPDAAAKWSEQLHAKERGQ